MQCNIHVFFYTYYAEQILVLSKDDKDLLLPSTSLENHDSLDSAIRNLLLDINHLSSPKLVSMEYSKGKSLDLFYSIHIPNNRVYKEKFLDITPYIPENQIVRKFLCVI